MLHVRLGEFLIDFALEIFELALYFLVGGDLARGWDREGVRVLARDEFDAPRLQVEAEFAPARVEPGLAGQLWAQRGISEAVCEWLLAPVEVLLQRSFARESAAAAAPLGVVLVRVVAWLRALRDRDVRDIACLAVRTDEATAK